MINLIISLAIDAACGYLAGMLMNTKCEWYINIVLGIVGGIVGSILFGIIGLSATGLIGQIIVSVIGACVVVFLYQKFVK